MMARLIRKVWLRLLHTKPDWARRRYARLCKKSRLEGSVLLLSFDCDNDEDIEALGRISGFLNSHGARATFAVPGEVLLAGQEQFSRLHEAGHEFIGHGYRKHSNIVEGKYISTLYYHKLNDQELREDITKGNETLRELLGSYPMGFRIPHFGHSNDDFELNRVYKVLRDCTICYSSSALPWRGLTKGPIYRSASSLYELPVSGTFDNPLAVFDTYSFGFHPRNDKNYRDYLEDVKKSVNFYSGRAVCLNIYCDPSQAVQMDEWFEAMEYAISKGYSVMRLGDFFQRYATAWEAGR